MITAKKYRWDLSATNQLPDYMKLVFKFVVNVYGEFVEEMTKKGKPYAAQFARDRVKLITTIIHFPMPFIFICL